MNLKKSPCLCTPRLCLKSIPEDQEENFLKILLDSEVCKTYMIPVFSHPEEARKLFARFRELSSREDRLVYGIFLEENCIGFLNDVEMTDEHLEVGYVVHPDYKNRGIATEAFTALIREAFRLGFPKVRAGAFEENRASLRVMEKCGLTRIPFTEEIEYRGNTHHCVYYEISNPNLKER